MLSKNKRPLAGLLISGNEVLYGKTQDTNGPFLAKTLEDLGFTILCSIVAADKEDLLLVAIQHLVSHCDFIFMTGGLGPTSDDLTAKVLANFLSRPLQFHEQAWKTVEEYYTFLGRPNPPESNRKQAFLPSGSIILPNPNGTACGFMLELESTSKKQSRIFCLPGVPFEMRAMFQSYVVPFLPSHAAVLTKKVYQIMGMGESALAQKILEIEKVFAKNFLDASLSYQAHPAYVTLTFSFESQIDSRFDVLIHQPLVQILGRSIFYQSAEPIESIFVSILQKRNLQMSLKDFLTQGQICAQINWSKENYCALKTAEVYLKNCGPIPEIVFNPGAENEELDSNTIYLSIEGFSKFAKIELLIPQRIKPALEVKTYLSHLGWYFIDTNSNLAKHFKLSTEKTFAKGPESKIFKISAINFTLASLISILNEEALQ